MRANGLGEMHEQIVECADLDGNTRLGRERTRDLKDHGAAFIG